MKRLGRDSWLAIGLFLLFVLIAVIAAVQQAWAEQQKRAPSLASTSSKPDGARALWLWLGELGHPVDNGVSTYFRFPEDTTLTLMLEPSHDIVPEEWRRIDEWVEDGGTLVLAGDQWNTLLAFYHYDFDLNYLYEQSSPLVPQTPLFRSPPLSASVDVRTRAYFQTDRDDYVAHLAVASGPVLVSFEKEAGRVILSATPFPFSNAGLKEEGNPALLLNIVAAARQRGVIWFDEWHHGVRLGTEEVIGPGDWLRYTPAGQSLLYVAGVILLALVLRGQRFGRPVPLPRRTARRTPLEYVTAIANLSRRAKHRQAVLNDYHHQVKRKLSKRYRLNPTLPDNEYVDQLAKFNPELDAEALRSLLTRLHNAQVGESGMIQLAAEAAQWLEELR